MKSLLWLLLSCGNDREKMLDLAYIIGGAAIAEFQIGRDGPEYLAILTRYHETAELLAARMNVPFLATGSQDQFRANIEKMRQAWMQFGRMSERRFNELMSSMHHPDVPIVTVCKVTEALHAVMNACGPTARDALEEFCAATQEKPT